MRTITYKLADLGKAVIHLGKANENEATRVQIDAGVLFAEYPTAVPTLKVINPAGTVYSAEVTRDGDYVLWDIKDSDLTENGSGEFQLTFTEDGVVVKSAISRTQICPSITGGGTAPDPVQDWVDQAEEVLEDVEEALEAFPTGGTTGQVLAKASNDDYDTEWVDQGSGGTTDYTELTNKPKIGGVTLTGDKSLSDLGAASASEVSAKYTKPSGGIPASDIADGVIPDPTSIIDDTAGDGDTNKVWSADKTDAELADVKSAINVLEPSASASDVGKMLKVKTVADGKVTEYEFGEGGGGSVTVDDELSTSSTNPVQNKVITGALNNKVESSLMKKCELVEIIGTNNKWDKSIAQVGFLYKNGNVYTGGNYDNYVYGDYIPVQPNDVIRFYYVQQSQVKELQVGVVASYDSSKTIDSSSSVSDVKTYTVPNGINYIRITMMGDFNSSAMAIINDATVPSEYIPYSEADAYYLATSNFIPQSVISQAASGKVDKDGVKQVTVENCEFMEFSPNLFDKTTVVTGLLNKGTGAVLSSYTNYVTSDFIEVKSGTDYTFSATTDAYLYWCWYDSSKAWLSGYEKLMSLEPTKESPSNAKYIRFSISPDIVNNNIQFEKGSQATAYKEYGVSYVKPEYMPPEDLDIEFNLPLKVYALVGYETNIYFENLVEDWTKYEWDVSCTKGMQMERGYRITPISTDAGSYTLSFVISSGKVSKTFSTTLVVVGASAGSGVSETLIVLGDSTTANGIAVTKLNANLANDMYSVSTIGTQGTSPNQHEGRSGWRFSSYFTESQNNAFYNPTSQTFDADYYFTNSGVAKPDWFFINLGINDVFGSTSDSALNTAIAGCKEYCDAMIESILDASPNTKIGICLTIPPNHSQDAFGKEYNCGQNRARYKRNNTLWVNALIEEYDGRESEGIYLIPINLALDTVYNMGLETLPVNARNTSITYESPIGNGGVHPVESGYWQIADVYTAFLKGNAT